MSKGYRSPSHWGHGPRTQTSAGGIMWPWYQPEYWFVLARAVDEQSGWVQN